MYATSCQYRTIFTIIFCLGFCCYTFDWGVAMAEPDKHDGIEFVSRDGSIRVSTRALVIVATISSGLSGGVFFDSAREIERRIATLEKACGFEQAK